MQKSHYVPIYAECPMGCTSKMKEEKRDLESLLPTEVLIKLRTQQRPLHAPKPATLESRNHLTQLAQHATHESKTKYTLLYAKGHLAQPEIF
jgi:hypothetical protein